jgi:hypothetical protein
MMTSMMMISAIYLKRITESVWPMIFFSVSYFTIIQCLGSEQYQLSIFFIILAVHKSIKNNFSLYSMESIMLSGSTITSGHLIPFLVKFKGMLGYSLDLLRYCILFVGVVSLFGVSTSIIQLLNLYSQFSDRTMPLLHKLYDITHFFKWCFLAPQPVISSLNDGLVYNGGFNIAAPTTISYFGIGIFLVCVISICIHWKNPLTKICAFNILIIFVLRGWGHPWMLVIFTSWAYIILIWFFLKKFIGDKKLKIICCTLFFTISLMNLYSLTNFIRFCVQNYSILSR